jgi:putative peptide zinc metalloprotease protein
MLALRPTFSESWYRVAALRIRLRPGAEITRQYYRGERWYVVRDPAGTQFMRLSDGAYQFVGLLDGKRTVAEAWELVGGQMDDAAPTQPEVIQILSQLHGANLIEADITPDAQVLLRRHKSVQRQQWKQRAMNLLFPRIPLPFDLNGIVTRWMPVARILFSKGGLVLWLIVVGAALITIAPNSKALWEQHTEAMAFQNWGWLWLVFVFTKVIHEFGHAFACRKFGGEVHEMGIMFLVFVPTPYVDASSAWAFPSRWQRMFVGAAGMFTELFFAALMAFVWTFTDHQTNPILNGMAYNAMLVASVSTVLFNVNPLLRYDGYYMLSDLLEIPNLQQKSKEYGWGLIKRHVFKIKQQQPLPPLTQRLWLFNYWWSSSIYRVFVGLMIIVVVQDRVPVLGILMALGGLVTWAVVPVFTLVRYLSIGPELHRKRTLGWGFSLAMGCLIAGLVGLVKLPVWVWSDAIMQPEQREVLRTEYDGFLKEVGPGVADEKPVTAGQVLMVLENRNLTQQIAETSAKLEAAKIRFQQAILTDQAQRRIEETQIEALTSQLKELTDREAKLTIRAPFNGTFISPHLRDMMGAYLKRGQEVATVSTPELLEARAVIDQQDSHYIGEYFVKRARELGPNDRDDRTKIRLAGAISESPISPIGPAWVVPASQKQLPHPSLGLTGGGEVQTDPKDQQGMKPVSEPFEVVLKVDNSSGRYVPGQRAYVRFHVEDRPLAWQVWRRVQQLIQGQDINSKWS